MSSGFINSIKGVAFKDNTWGNLKIPSYCIPFIDTYEFQRMRNMKQLGSSYYHFSSASGNRFEHSIGVSFLSNYFAKTLLAKFPKIVKDDHVKLITLAGLLHDIGHGPFSHLFEKVTNVSHEKMTIEIIKSMVSKYTLDITHKEMEIVFDIISPPVDKKGSWLYQIVSNSIDTDRMDYILRDSANVGIPIFFNKYNAFSLINSAVIENEQIEFKNSDKVIDDFFSSREFMYKRVYLSEKSIQVENLIIHILKEAKINENIKCLDDFIKLDDGIINQLYWNTSTKHLVDKLIKRQYEI